MSIIGIQQSWGTFGPIDGGANEPIIYLFIYLLSFAPGLGASMAAITHAGASIPPTC